MAHSSSEDPHRHTGQLPPKVAPILGETLPGPTAAFNHGAPPTLPAGDEPGTMLGRCQIFRKIGRGGMGGVLRGASR